uniref:BPTI/Kunitz inhibitor domain-containing protein n=1 Tax=Caenorhabditis japonica TaxID=281687 RepID=A0A8R1E6X5_CAEJA
MTSNAPQSEANIFAVRLQAQFAQPEVDDPSISSHETPSIIRDFWCTLAKSRSVSTTIRAPDDAKTLCTRVPAEITTTFCRNTSVKCTVRAFNVNGDRRCGLERKRKGVRTIISARRLTSAKRIRACVVRENVETICAQPLRIGDCTENVKRYWYNAKTRQCQMFEYTGCQGNDNNFDSILDCQNFCKNAIPEPKCIQGQAYKDMFGNFVTCSNGMGCPANYECYFDGSQWGCCPTKAFTCSLNPDAGIQCGAGSTFKYYYNPQTQNCESFQYN